MLNFHFQMDGKVIGSELVGQDLTDERLFHCRPSAVNYNTFTQNEKESNEPITFPSISIRLP